MNGIDQDFSSPVANLVDMPDNIVVQSWQSSSGEQIRSKLLGDWDGSDLIFVEKPNLTILVAFLNLYQMD